MVNGPSGDSLCSSEAASLPRDAAGLRDDGVQGFLQRPVGVQHCQDLPQPSATIRRLRFLVLRSLPLEQAGVLRRQADLAADAHEQGGLFRGHRRRSPEADDEGPEHPLLGRHRYADHLLQAFSRIRSLSSPSGYSAIGQTTGCSASGGLPASAVSSGSRETRVTNLGDNPGGP